MTVVGYPSIDTISAAPVNRGPGRRALLLPLYSIENDPGSLTGRVGDHLIAMIRMLRRQGFDGIRVKVHPGHANSGWYRAVLDQFGFAAVEVYCGGSIRCHAEWADIVIGPPTTGAMAECLALGRPYYAHVALPSGISTHHIPFVRMFTSAGELERALAAGWAPDCAAVLGDLCGGHGASARLWRALESQVSQSGDLPAQHPGKLQGRSTPG